MTENKIGSKIINTAIKIHRRLGPGLFESVYEEVFEYELKKENLYVNRQVPIKFNYEEIQFEMGFKADLIINEKVILELKSKKAINEIDKKQINTYLRLSGLKLGYLLNFGQELMKSGIIRVVNGLEE